MARMHLTLLLPLLLANADAVGQSSNQWVRVRGSVELTPSDALHSAEQRARNLLWQRFSPRWTEQAGWFVSAKKLEKNLRQWMHRRLDGLGVLRERPMEVRDVTVGKAYRQEFELPVRGPAARNFQRSGEIRAARFGRHFRGRLLWIGGICMALLFLASRLDRATRGYLTGRIRLACLAVAVVSAWLLIPG